MKISYLPMRNNKAKRTKIKNNYWINLSSQIEYLLNIHFQQLELNDPFPYSLANMLYTPNIYKSYIPVLINNKLDLDESLKKINDERVYEHQKIRKLLLMFNENKDKNKVFPFDLALRIYNISNDKLLESLEYDNNYNYEREHPKYYYNKKMLHFIDRRDYSSNTEFIDVEADKFLDNSINTKVNLDNFIASRDYILEKCCFFDKNYIYKDQVNYDNLYSYSDSENSSDVEYSKFKDFTV